ncbi:hypothetical protein VUR80DRAFT_7930 [Thermomyces stellatus]
MFEIVVHEIPETTWKRYDTIVSFARLCRVVYINGDGNIPTCASWAPGVSSRPRLPGYTRPTSRGPALHVSKVPKTTREQREAPSPQTQCFNKHVARGGSLANGHFAVRWSSAPSVGVVCGFPRVALSVRRASHRRPWWAGALATCMECRGPGGPGSGSRGGLGLGAASCTGAVSASVQCGWRLASRNVSHPPILGDWTGQGRLASCASCHLI